MNNAQPKPAPSERGNAETQKAIPSKRLRLSLIRGIHSVPEAMKEQALSFLDEQLPAIPADRSLMMARPGGAG